MKSSIGYSLLAVFFAVTALAILVTIDWRIAVCVFLIMLAHTLENHWNK